MANESTTGFGMRPIRTVGQTDDNSGLGEFQVAASSTAIYHHDPVLTATSGYITVSAASSGANYAGVLNGSFYVDPTTSKPTWSNYAPSVAAEQNVLLISNPQAHVRSTYSFIYTGQNFHWGHSRYRLYSWCSAKLRFTRNYERHSYNDYHFAN